MHDICVSQKQLSMAGCLAPLQEHGDMTPSKRPTGRTVCRHASASRPLHAAILGRGECVHQHMQASASCLRRSCALAGVDSAYTITESSLGST